MLCVKFWDTSKDYPFGQRIILLEQGFGRRLMRGLPNAIGMDKDDFDPSALLGLTWLFRLPGRRGL